MNYRETIAYLNSLTDYEKLCHYAYTQSFSLGRIQRFLCKIGNPQKGLRVIHVAGSKGKGSVCAFIAYILKEAGLKVGLFTSPHLVDMRERIRILYRQSPPQSQNNDFEGMISERSLRLLTQGLRPAIEAFNRNSTEDKLTYFEVITAMAFCYFKQQKVDIAVLETGLGGRFDATNTCSSLVAVITPISYEHTMYLGKNIGGIAFEKASIIKKENQLCYDGMGLAVTARQQQVLGVIERVCKVEDARLFQKGRDFDSDIRKEPFFDYRSENIHIRNLVIRLKGRHQIDNATLAIAAIEALRYYKLKIGPGAIRKGLLRCRWPGRFQVLSRNPLLIVDGAHTKDSMRALRMALWQYYPGRRVYVIFGIAQDKELQPTCLELAKISREIILTQSKNPRASRPKDLVRFFRKAPVHITNSTAQALGVARALISRKDIILVTGSLYLCGEAYELLSTQ